MLPIPKLDDQNFGQIYQTYTKRMADLSAGKADLSYQDPGVTLLELFSLLKDMQQYYLDYVSEEHVKKHEKLHGGPDYTKFYKAVTISDYEQIIKEMDSIDIEEVHGIYDNNEPECITLVVKPAGDKSDMTLDQEQKRFIEGHLEDYRLLTTRLRIKSPVYYQLWVFVKVKCLKQIDEEKLRIDLKKEILQYFYGADGKKKNQFAKAIPRGEVYGILRTKPGVSAVETLRINCQGVREISGLWQIPEDGIAIIKEVAVVVEKEF